VALQHEKLVAWQRADDLYIDLHRLTGSEFPASERFGLTSQTRRAAFSVAANIVEGVSRRSIPDRLRF
jgi:four helix bundle protein